MGKTFQVPLNPQTYAMRRKLPDPWDTRDTMLVDNYEFEETLTFDNSYTFGNNSFFEWKDEVNRVYYMFVGDLTDVLKSGRMQGSQVTGTWTFQKRGKYFGIKLAK